MSNTPLRDKLVQLENETFDAAWKSGKGYSEAQFEMALAVKQYEEQALARLALYGELVKASQAVALALEAYGRDAPGELVYLKFILAQAEALKGE